MHYFWEAYTFWPVQNNQPAIDSIKKRKGRNKALLIAIYEFFIIYVFKKHLK